jgi:SAM-dependent methyltransferase
MERVGNGIQSVLDYGCGRGQDVERLRAARPELEVAGFEPLQPPPAFSELPTGTFDLVLFNYVVNILPSLRERIEATRGAWAKVRPGGTLFISSRTPAAVGEQGERYLDGWISSARRSTFQRGHTAPELERLAAWLDQVEEVDSGVKGDFAWTTFRKTGGSWPTPPPAGTRLIDRRADLADVTEALAEADIVGVDVETFDRRHQVLSTVQLAVEGQVFVVDALAIRDLGWLRPVLEDPSTLKVIHNATFEQTAFRRYGLELQNVFCTLKVAKRAVPGPHTLEALAKRLLDVELNKTQQRSDWSLRPLTPAQIAYAATDASILLRLFRELRKATLA